MTAAHGADWPANLVVPAYGSVGGRGALADVLPSLLSAVGLNGYRNQLEVARTDRAALLLVDGLGWELLIEHAEQAPFLATLAAGDQPITAGFPTTTTSSLTSLGTGRTTGEHGMTGYQMRVPGEERLLNGLQWDVDRGPAPEAWQPWPTMLELAAGAGVAMTMIAPAEFATTGLTRAALRGGRYLGIDDIAEYAPAVRAGLETDGPAMAYAYYGALDRTGHVLGTHSREWRDELARVDRLAEALAAALPSGTPFYVTADHGMVDLDPHAIVEVTDSPGLQVGVRMLAGEGRCRYVHTAPGAARDTRDIWADELGDDFLVLARDDAVAQGLFGPVVTEAALERIGDVIALARGPGAVFDARIDSALVRNLVAHHGSLTSAEAYVPFLRHEVG